MQCKKWATVLGTTFGTVSESPKIRVWRSRVVTLICLWAFVSPIAEANGQAGPGASGSDSCYLLNPVEVAATLRGPGVVVVARRRKDRGLDECQIVRTSRPGSLGEILRQFETEVPLILAVIFSDDLGSKGFELFPVQPGITRVEVPGLGDRAVFQNGDTALLLVASGPKFLGIDLIGKTPNEGERQDVIDLAREALATNFDGWQVVEYKIADRAIANDRATLETDPKAFAFLLFQMKRFDEARSYNLRALAANPDDADVMYLQGVIDWVLTYQVRSRIRARIGLPPQQILEDKAFCTDVKKKNQQEVGEGIAVLTKVVKLQPDSDDAMAYLSLLFRERADYECDDNAARSADLKMADSWQDNMERIRTENLSRRDRPKPPPLLMPLPPAPPLPTTASQAAPRQ